MGSLEDNINRILLLYVTLPFFGSLLVGLVYGVVVRAKFKTLAYLAVATVLGAVTGPVVLVGVVVLSFTVNLPGSDPMTLFVIVGCVVTLATPLIVLRVCRFF